MGGRASGDGVWGRRVSFLSSEKRTCSELYAAGRVAVTAADRFVYPT